MKRPTPGSRKLVTAAALGLAALITLAASARPDAAAAVPALPGAEVSDADLRILVEAAKSCPALTPARLAGQVMAASQFSGDPVQAVSAAGGRGAAGLTPQTWRKWAPWQNAKQTDSKASIVALAHGMCDLVGQLRVVKLTGDQWRLALAAHRVGMAPVIQAATVPAGAREYVDTVERYAVWYALQPQFGGSGDPSPASSPTDPAVADVPLLPVPDQYVAAVVEAGRICRAVPPTRIAAQIMATSAFDAQKLGPAGQQGIGQFLPQVWVRYVPQSSSTPWSDQAAVKALGTTMCAMVKEHAKQGKDAYPVALAAFRRGDSSVRNKADVAGSASLTALVTQVARYEGEYLKDVRLVRPAAAPSTPAKPTPTSDPTTSAPKPTKTGSSTAGRSNQPPIKAADGDGSGRVYGPYYLHNHGTGLCVDIPGYGAGPRDGPVNQAPCLPKIEDNQEFAFVPGPVDGDGYQLYKIRNIDSGYCLDPPGLGSNPGGTPLSETGCFDGDNQDWRLEKSIKVGKFQHYWLRNAASGMCLDVPGDANAPKDTRLALSPCQKKNDHDWSLVQKAEW
ncbi:RICIN domain-containing protein [Actinoplanes sp. NPDC049599]|uniref:RICIN domain-containing protein n=1 Tax=Actinoplanes sp. NPDC049599 TaxID=3363903 RepID=UPI0037A46543